MTLKSKIKSYSFWISLVSAILIIIRVVCEQLNLIINESVIMDVVTGICGVLVLLGILSSPTQRKEDMQDDKIIDQVKDLNNTIKEDLNNTQMSIQEQIEFLQKRSNLETIEVLPKLESDALDNDSKNLEGVITDSNESTLVAEKDLNINNKENEMSEQNPQNLNKTDEIMVQSCDFEQNLQVLSGSQETLECQDFVEDSSIGLELTCLETTIDEQKIEDDCLDKIYTNNDQLLLDIKYLLQELINKLN